MQIPSSLAGRTMMRCMVLLVLALLVAACATGTDNDVSPPPPTETPILGGERPTAVPTLPPPDYVEAAAPITADNASRLQYLGRLDVPSRSPTTLFDHSVSPDGTRMAAINSSSLTAWDLLDGRVLFSTSNREARSVFYSADKTEIYTIDNNGLVTVWDAEQGIVRTTFEGQPIYGGVNAYNAFNGWLAIGGDDGRVKVWSPIERISQVTIDTGIGLPVVALAFSEDGERLAVATQNGIVTVWHWADRTLLATFDHDGAFVNDMVFAPDGESLATGTLAYVAVWSVAEDTLRYSISVEEGGTSAILAYTPTGDYLVVGGGNADLRVITPDEGRVVAQLPDVSGNRMAAAFAARDQLMMTSVLGRGVALWNLAAFDGQTVPRATLDIGTRNITSVAWTDDGFLVLFFDAGGSVYVWGIAERAA